MHVRNRNPEFCIIAPTEFLNFTTDSRSHLALAHLVDNDDTYADFYANLDDNHFIIMDNGAFELGGSYDKDKLLSLGERCMADAIVLPDFPGRPCEETIIASESIMQDVIDGDFLTMFVPQSEVGDLEDWIAGYEYAANNPNIDIIGMSILGIPNALPHIDASFSRVVITQILIERGIFNPDKHHHYLGLNAGPALEIPSLLRMNALDTCDSSNPVWTAILGHEYNANTDSLLNVRKPKMHVNFDQPWTNDQATLDRIQHNINMTLSLFE